MSDIVIYSFLVFLGSFILIGLLSVRQRQKSAEDYLLASRSISPAFVGLSAAASTASGFGFTGIIGFGYAMGLAGGWFIFGIIFGSLAAFWLTSRRFRVYSQRHKTASYTEFLACGEGSGGRTLRLVLGLLSIAAVTLYATAQLTAGSKALHVLFDWDYSAGAILGAVIVLMYCWAGGIRASIWTDVAQIIVMYGAMTLLMIASLKVVGGFSGLYESLEAIDPKLVAWTPQNNPFGPLLFILGCLSVGISFIGFPHVMVRFMTLKKPKDTTKALLWFEGSYGAFYVTAYIVAVSTRVLVPGTEFDTELALPKLAMELLPDVLVGVILAGIFAGTISTADSLVLSSTASLSRDIFHKYKESYLFMKISTLAVTGLALGIALLGSKSVFDLVLFVIAIMGAGFAPLLLVRVMRWPITEKLALAMIAAGLAAAVYWRMAGYHVHIFDSLPGMVTAMVVYGAGLLMLRQRQSLQNKRESHTPSGGKE
ncbi:MAG: sodium/proline symporter [Rhodospirillales bacterium]|nr:sodium/proline symporter [Rhodospirillales bacterium]MCB9995553.1 sodium/proline symporter [Rhodospirillales bacterium]